MSTGRLEGRVAVVTGAGGGLGSAIARRFVQEGARVVLTDVDAERGRAVAAEVGGEFALQDVTDEERWRSLTAQVLTSCGRLDILVNNAGYAPLTAGLTPEDIDLDQSRRIFRVNFDGTLLGCKHGIAAMKRDGGSIINLSSIAALMPVPFITAYGAAKAAVRHLTTSVALHCARAGYGIRCNCIHPGQVRTAMHDELVAKTAATGGISRREAEERFRQMIPLGDYGRAEDVANAALYLASDESRHVTGDRLVVDGGMLLAN